MCNILIHNLTKTVLRHYRHNKPHHDIQNVLKQLDSELKREAIRNNNRRLAARRRLQSEGKSDRLVVSKRRSTTSIR